MPVELQKTTFRRRQQTRKIRRETQEHRWTCDILVLSSETRVRHTCDIGCVGEETRVGVEQTTSGRRSRLHHGTCAVTIHTQSVRFSIG
jgi:hypothetical protein